MKTKLIIVIAAVAGLANLLTAEVRPIVAARDHLGKAQSILANIESGGGKKRRASIETAIGELNRTESKLAEAKNNKGSNTDVALKFIGEAKAELEGARESKEEKSAHLQKAGEAMDEAMKRVKLAVAVKK